MKYTCRAADCGDGPQVPGAWIVERGREWVAIAGCEADAKRLVLASNALSIEDELAAIRDGVPKSEWDKLPADLSENLDHYLYGAPKQV